MEKPYLKFFKVLAFSQDAPWRRVLFERIYRTDLGDQKQNPHFEDAQREIMGWSCKVGLLQTDTPAYGKSQKAEFAQLCALSLHASPKEHVVASSKLVAWLFERDNKLDSRAEEVGEDPEHVRAINEGLLKVLDDRDYVPQTASESGLKDLLSLLPESNQALLRKRFDSYFQSNYVEAKYRKSKALPDKDTYKEFRVHSSAVQVYYEYMRILEHATLSEKQRENIEFTRLENISALIVGVHNDLFSIGNELTENYSDNYIKLEMEDLKRKTRESDVKVLFKQAVENTLEFINEQVEIFLRQSEAFLKEQGEYAKEIDRMKRLIEGNLQWSVITDRYKKLPAELAALFQ